VEGDATDVGPGEREEVVVVPRGAQVGDGGGEEAEVGEGLGGEPEVVGERGLEEGEALGRVGAQVAHVYDPLLDDKAQPTFIHL
jgi:hypothetical protein